MSALTSSICFTAFPRLGQDPGKASGLQTWLLAGTFVPSSPIRPDKVILERVSQAQIVGFLNYDYERFALSALETYSLIRADRAKANVSGWPLIKAYYSCFFAAHSIMRAMGSGVLHISSSSAAYLTQVLEIYDVEFKGFSPGTYFFRIYPSISSPADLCVELIRAGSGQGVHESFWSFFSNYLVGEAQSAIEKGMPDSAQFFAEASALADQLKLGASGGGYWISSMRNEINYQHKYEAWLPGRKASECYSALLETPRLSSAQIGISKSKLPVTSFLNTTMFVVNVGVELGNHVAVRSSVGGAFGQKWRRLSAIFA